jgi:hypothetical protein
MHLAVRRVTSIVLLVAAFWSLTLGPECDTPQRYDGDGDDAGLIGQVLFRGVDVSVTDASPTFVPSTPARCRPVTTAARPPRIARVPLGSRAPPA